MLFEKQIIGVYKKTMHSRCDDMDTVHYFSAEDFEGLSKESYRFTASAGHTLQGYIYQYQDPKPERLVVFDHGFGGGHRAYMKEIEMLCRHGYTVFSYDHTGCMESGGDSPNGMAQSLCDLNDCISTLKADARFAGRSIAVIGHSWGGFSTANISALHPEITHVVDIAGFVAVKEIIDSLVTGVLKYYRKAIMNVEHEANPVFSEFHAVDSLKRSKAKALLIYSDDDHIVNRKNYDILKEGLEDRENTRFLLVSGKRHNPNYTEKAVGLLKEFSDTKHKLLRNKKVTVEQRREFAASFDWNAMTEQDAAVWQVIFEHLES